MNETIKEIARTIKDLADLQIRLLTWRVESVDDFQAVRDGLAGAVNALKMLDDELMVRQQRRKSE